VCADVHGAELELVPAFALAPGEGRAGLELVVSPPGALTGRVLAPGGRSISGMRVIAIAVGADIGGRWDPEIATLGADGAFELPALRAGATRVFLTLPEVRLHHASGFRGSSTYVWSGDSLANAIELGTVEVPSGATLERDFSPPLSAWPGALELDVRVDGAPAALVHVTLHDELTLVDVELQTDAEGRIAGAPVFAGTWLVSVAHPDEGWSVALPEPLFVRAGQTTVSTLDVERP
jgi:hypothetical protein